MNATRTLSVTVRLSGSEQFQWKTPTGLIRVMVVTISPSDFRARRPHAMVRGRAIKKDGTEAYFDREGFIPFDDLTPDILEVALKAMQERAVTEEEWIKATAGAYEKEAAVRG